MAIARDGSPVTGGGNGVNSFTLGALSTSGANEIIIVIVDNSNSSTSVSTVASTNLTSSHWHKLASNTKGSNGTIEFWYTLATTQLSSEVITVTMVGSNFPQVSGIGAAYTGTLITGTDGVNAFDTDTNAGSGSQSGSMSNTVTTGVASAFVIAGAGIDSNTTLTAGSNQTFASTTSGGTSSQAGLLEQNSVTSASGTVVTTNFTFSGSHPAGIISVSLSPHITVDVSDTEGTSDVLEGYSDTIATREQVTVTITGGGNNITVNDTEATSENVVVVIPTPTVIVNDTEGTSEHTVLLIPTLFITVEDFPITYDSLYVSPMMGVHTYLDPLATYDNFSENFLDPSLWTASFSADPTQVTVSNSQLQITHSTGPQYNDAVAVTIYNFTGCSTYVQVVDAGNQSLVSHGVNLGIKVDTNNYAYISASDGNLQAWKFVSGTQSQIGSNITYSATTHAWWRIRESSGTLYFDTAPDGVTWTNRWSVADPWAVTSIYPYAQAGCYNTEASGSYGYFDNFYLPVNTQQWQTFNSDAGRNSRLLEIYQAWGNTDGFQNFVPGVMNGIVAAGAIPVVTWEPWVAGGGTSQPTYSLANIAAGNFDSYIIQFAQAAKAWGQVFYMRFAHEMNGTWYPWSEQENGNSAGQYVTAWQHVYTVFQNQGVYNAKWIWAPNMDYAGGTTISELYPGDAYVNLIGVDGYNFGTDSGTAGWQTFTQVFSATYTELQAISSLPILITETASTEDGGSKAAWITAAFPAGMATMPAVTGFIWFNENDTIDWQIESSMSSQAAFNTAMSATNVMITTTVGVSDTEGTSENLLRMADADPKVSDTEGTSENVQLLIPTLFITVNDTEATSENVQLLELSFVSVHDTEATSENVVASITDNITVNDTEGTSENTQVMADEDPKVNDTEATSENTVAFIPFLLIAVNDTEGTSEAILMQDQEGIAVLDSEGTSENTVLLIPTLFITVNDTEGTSENTVVNIPLTVAVNDTEGTSENLLRMADTDPKVSDTEGTSENTVVQIVTFIDVSDTEGTSENVRELIPFLLITVNDTEATSENVVVNIPVAGSEIVVVSDTEGTSENVVVLIPFLLVTVNDTESTSENVTTPAISYGIDVTPGPSYTINGVKVV